MSFEPLPSWLAIEVDHAFSAYAQPGPGGSSAMLPAASLGPLLRALGQAPTPAEISDLLSAAAAAAGAPAPPAALTCADVHRLLAGKLSDESARDHGARAAFECMAGADGCISRGDLARVLESLGAVGGDADLDAMLAVCGARGADARVAFADFAAVLASSAAAAAAATPPRSGKR